MTILNTTIKKDSGNEGFSMVELLIALSIFSIGCLAVTKLMIGSIGLNSNADKYSEVLTRLQERLEIFLTVPYGDATLTPVVDLTPAGDADGIDNDFDGTIDEAGEQRQYYTISWTITETDIDGNPGTGLKTIDITGTWNQQAIGTRSITLRVIKPDLLIQ